MTEQMKYFVALVTLLLMGFFYLLFLEKEDNLELAMDDLIMEEHELEIPVYDEAFEEDDDGDGDTPVKMKRNISAEDENERDFMERTLFLQEAINPQKFGVLGPNRVSGQIKISKDRIEDLGITINPRNAPEINFDIGIIDLDAGGSFVIETDTEMVSGLLLKSKENTYKLRFVTGPLADSILLFGPEQLAEQKIMREEVASFQAKALADRQEEMEMNEPPKEVHAPFDDEKAESDEMIMNADDYEMELPSELPDSEISQYDMAEIEN
jgi:hypothetical protein